MNQKQIHAVVQMVVEGDRGPYAVATASDFEGSITFSLDPSVWQESIRPGRGTHVILSNLERKQAGWRANKVRLLQPEDEQASSKVVTKYLVNALIRQLKKQEKPVNYEKKWKRWVDFAEREWRDLTSLVADPEISDAYKTRALFILLVPDFRLIPYYWKIHESIFKSYVDLGTKIDLKSLAPKQLDDAKEFLYIFFAYAKAYDLKKCMYTYNNYVLELMSILPSDQALKWLDLFELNDVYEWINMDDLSGYNPFRDLLYNKALSNDVKVVADIKMRLIILQELSGLSTPRAKHEDSLFCYSNITQLWIFGYKKGAVCVWGMSLFLDQVEFIIDSTPVTYPNASRIFEHWRIDTILAWAKSNGPEWLPNKFAKFIMEKGGGFTVYDKRDIVTAQSLIEILKDEADYITTLRKEIAIGKLHIDAIKRGVEQEKEEEGYILKDMSI